MAERNYTKARIEFRNALQVDPKDAAVRELVGVTSERLGEYDDAVKAYRIALAADESLVTSRARLARLMALGGLSDEAMELLAPGFERAPQSGELLSVRAIIRGQKGDLGEARKDAEQAYALEPGNADVVATLAAMKWQVGERAETIALLDGRDRQEPRQPRAESCFWRACCSSSRSPWTPSGNSSKWCGSTRRGSSTALRSPRRIWCRAMRTRRSRS